MRGFLLIFYLIFRKNILKFPSSLWFLIPIYGIFFIE